MASNVLRSACIAAGPSPPSWCCACARRDPAACCRFCAVVASEVSGRRRAHADGVHHRARAEGSIARMRWHCFKLTALKSLNTGDVGGSGPKFERAFTSPFPQMRPPVWVTCLCTQQPEMATQHAPGKARLGHQTLNVRCRTKGSRTPVPAHQRCRGGCKDTNTGCGSLAPCWQTHIGEDRERNISHSKSVASLWAQGLQASLLHMLKSNRVCAVRRRWRGGCGSTSIRCGSLARR